MPFAKQPSCSRRLMLPGNTLRRDLKFVLDRIEDRLKKDGVEVLRFSKPTFAKVAPIDLRREIRERCDAVIEALAD